MVTNQQMQLRIIWQHVLVDLQNVLNRTQDFIMENNNSLKLHKQMVMLNSLYAEAREIRSEIVEKAIDKGNLRNMLLEVSKAENELRKIVTLSICMQSSVCVKLSNTVVGLCNFSKVNANSIHI